MTPDQKAVLRWVAGGYVGDAPQLSGEAIESAINFLLDKGLIKYIGAVGSTPIITDAAVPALDGATSK